MAIMMPSADLRERVLAEAKRQQSLTRSQVRARNAALFISGLVVPLIIFLAAGSVPGDARPQALWIETSIGAGAVALTALVIALGRGRSTVGRSGMVLLGLAVLTPIVMLAWKLGVSSQFEGMMERWPERLGFRCLGLSCLLAAWPLVAFVMIRRGTDPNHPRLTGAAIGAAVGACSWMFVDLGCPVAYLPHLLLGHALPLIMATAAGAWLGKFVALTPR